ncbi:hypothetical protein WK09_19900 [Burkholderia ubonensis]|uniref:hypothetical protein n=1 Tax=Burkholderia ubonensis TaxID=101571 RepID=UPI000751D5D1|nr:hypothetical protein [Burkholderia ubonensis]KVQ87305.1 hypothetical protein WK09_19900 [Burkholderia ubonensis]
MNDQQQSRADAMTETPKEAMDRLHREFSAMSPFDQRMWLMRHAPLPSSQPAAAPADEMALSIDGLISICSARPQPGTPCGDAWEKGTRQGWQWAQARAALLAASPVEQPAAAPIPMLLFCPRCGTQHIDAPETKPDDQDDRVPVTTWANPPHRSHLCHACGIIWRPADVATVGVAAIETHGKADTWTAGTPWIGHNRPVDVSADETGEDGAKPVAWFIDWPDEPELGHYFAEEPCDPKYGRSRALGFIESRSPAMAAAAPAEEMIRFCPECGRLGDIPAGYEACCPDWSQARIVPKRFAELCAETFRLCVSQPFPQSTAAPADERAAFVKLIGYDRPDTEGVAQAAWDGQRATWLEALEYARAAASPAAEAADRSEAPLIGRWHHGNGVLVCGSIRVAVESFDTQPSQEFMGQMFDWICETLNTAIATPQPAQADAPADVTPIPYDGLTEKFTDEVARLANDPPGIREAVAGALESCGAIIAPADAPAEAREPAMSRGAFYSLLRAALKSYRDANPSRYLNDDQVDASDSEFASALADHHTKITPGSAPADAGEARKIHQVWIEQTSSYADVTPEYYAERQPSSRRIVYTAPPPARVASLTDAARDVLAERRRQVEAEGWTPEHDDKHGGGLMARAAACYAMAASRPMSHLVWAWDSIWPWDRSWWKPTTDRRNLVKAGGLILAEIERLDRAARPLQGADHD